MTSLGHTPPLSRYVEIFYTFYLYSVLQNVHADITGPLVANKANFFLTVYVTPRALLFQHLWDTQLLDCTSTRATF